MLELLSPKVDFIFKKIFGNEQNPDILISFLTAVLNPEHAIIDVEIKNNDISKDVLRDKFSILDVRATTSNNEVVNIEIQRADKYNMCKRTLYYWSKMYSSNIIAGEDYNVLPRTICINILDYNLKEITNNKYHNCYRLSNTEDHSELADIIEIHFIELKKFKTCNANILLDLWVEFINNPSSISIKNTEESNKEIEKALTQLKVISASDEEREKYEIRQTTIREEINSLNGAEEKGIKKGIKEGELNKSIEIARNSLDILDNETISKITGLPIEKIVNLRK